MANKSNFISDIAALARAGYKASDIKELLQLSKSTEPEAEEPASIPEKDPAQPDPANASTATKTKEAEEEPEESKNEDANEAKIKELEEQIKKLQNANASRDNSGDRSNNEKEIADIFASFM